MSAPRPRLGFVGVGWIGRDRLRAVAESGVAEVAVVADPDAARAAEALELAPGAARVGDLEEALEHDLDGVCIATPSALHAEQALAALERGVAVFCQKPLGRTAREAAVVVEAARRRDLLLGLDLAYRHTEAGRRVRDLVREGGIGAVHAGRLEFHNAYGPDAPWYRDRKRAGGGCVMDLGIHLVDLALWTLDFPEVERVEGRLWSKGRPLTRPVQGEAVEDTALATLELAGGPAFHLACSWDLHAGRDAAIEATFWGSAGGARFRNLGGSFYDFVAEHLEGTRTRRLSGPPDPWPGRAAVDWARRLARGEGFAAEADAFVRVARLLDRIYGHGSAEGLPDLDGGPARVEGGAVRVGERRARGRAREVAP